MTFLIKAEHQDPATLDAIPGIFSCVRQETLCSSSFFLFLFWSLAAERVPWLMHLVSPFSICAFWSGAGASEPVEALEKTVTCFVTMKTLCQAGGWEGAERQQKSDASLDPRELTQ